MREDRWLKRLRFLLGSGVLGWELVADKLRHWPPTFVLAVWLLGGPIEQLVQFFTAGRLQITMRQREDDESQAAQDKVDRNQGT
jgi:hypothetical protein